MPLAARLQPGGIPGAERAEEGERHDVQSSPPCQRGDGSKEGGDSPHGLRLSGIGRRLGRNKTVLAKRRKALLGSFSGRSLNANPCYEELLI
jgi:hypothetical protein